MERLVKSLFVSAVMIFTLVLTGCDDASDDSDDKGNDGIEYDSREWIIENKEVKNYLGYATNVVIPDGVTSIGAGVFNGFISLETVTIPESVKNIGAGAFSYCVSLKTIEFPEGTENIGEGAFASCTSLESVTIPKSMKSIGVWAFRYCTEIKTVQYGGTKDDWNKIENSSYLLFVKEVIGSNGESIAGGYDQIDGKVEE